MHGDGDGSILGASLRHACGQAPQRVCTHYRTKMQVARLWYCRPHAHGQGASMGMGTAAPCRMHGASMWHAACSMGRSGTHHPTPSRAVLRTLGCVRCGCQGQPPAHHPASRRPKHCASRQPRPVRTAYGHATAASSLPLSTPADAVRSQLLRKQAAPSFLPPC